MAGWQEKKTRFIHLIHVIKLQPICSNESREEVVLSCELVGAAQVCWESDSAADQEMFPSLISSGRLDPCTLSL